MALDQRDSAIVAQVAFKGAVEMLKGCLDGNDDMPGAVAELTAQFYDVMDSIVAANALHNAFPGSQTVGGPQAAAQAVQPNVAPLQPVPFAPGPGPAPLPTTGQTGIPRDQVVAMFMQDPSQFEDVRSKKRGPNSPDFLHRSMQNPNNPKYRLSLYLNWDEAAVIRQTYGI